MRPWLAALAAVAIGCGSPEVPRGGNFLVILVDDVGIDQIGAYRAHPRPPQTPAIDQLASEGLRFENAWAAAVCSPARAMLLTGRSPSRTGIGNVIGVRAKGRERLRQREQTVAELLKSKAHYSTAAVGKWHLVSPERPGHLGHPNRQGFDRFDGSVGPLSAAPPLVAPGYRNWLRVRDREEEVSTAYEPLVALEAAVDAMESLPQPWLVYAPFNLAHSPLHTPPADLVHTPVGPEPTELEQYRAMVEAADTLVGRLLARIPADALDDTTVIFAADNGTPTFGISAPLDSEEGKDTLHEGGLRVPLIVRSPLIADPGGVRTQLVSLVDVLPTLAEIAGVESRRELDGISLLPLFSDPAAPGHEMLAIEQFWPNMAGPSGRRRERFAARNATHKWIVGGDGKGRLFALDPTGIVETGPIPESTWTVRERSQARRLEAFAEAQAR